MERWILGARHGGQFRRAARMPSRDPTRGGPKLEIQLQDLMIGIQISRILSGAPQASVYSLEGAGVTTVVSLLGGLLLAILGGILVFRRRKKTADKTEGATEAQAGLVPAVRG